LGFGFAVDTATAERAPVEKGAVCLLSWPVFESPGMFLVTGSNHCFRVFFWVEARNPAGTFFPQRPTEKMPVQVSPS